MCDGNFYYHAKQLYNYEQYDVYGRGIEGYGCVNSVGYSKKTSDCS
jgi:hypothetical protein